MKSKLTHAPPRPGLLNEQIEDDGMMDEPLHIASLDMEDIFEEELSENSDAAMIVDSESSTSSSTSGSSTNMDGEEQSQESEQNDEEGAEVIINRNNNNLEHAENQIEVHFDGGGRG